MTSSCLATKERKGNAPGHAFKKQLPWWLEPTYQLKKCALMYTLLYLNGAL